MALRACAECSGEVSDQASACPHCGCPVEPQIACPDCGGAFEAWRAACPACGRPVASEAPEPEDTKGHPALVSEAASTPEAGFWSLHWYLRVLKKYAVFSGRAHRKEYWSFVVFSLLISFALGLVEGWLGLWSYTDESVLAFIYNLGILIPCLAVGVRRVHDSDHSGWFVLVPFYNLYLVFIEGGRGTNRFGDDPQTSS